MHKTAAVRSQARRAALAGAAMSKQAQVKLLAGASRAAGLRQALSSGKVVLPKARSTKQLISAALGNLRGDRRLGWPPPAYLGRNERDKRLLDLLLRFKSLGTDSTKGGRMTNRDTIQLLRRLNGNTAIVGPQEAAALGKSIVPPRPVGVDLSGMKLPVK